MRRICRVMVTGAGSGVGQGIVKALRVSQLPVTVIGADIAPMNAALYRTDEAAIIPRVEQADALEQIIALLRLLRVDVVMIGSEFDLEFFSRNRTKIEQESGALVIADNTYGGPALYPVLELGADLSVVSLTKYVAGHSDVMMGAVSATAEALPALARVAGQLGQCAAPDDCHLARVIIIRQLDTLAGHFDKRRFFLFDQRRAVLHTKT